MSDRRASRAVVEAAPRPSEAVRLGGGDLVAQLRSTLDRAAELVCELDSPLSQVGPGEPAHAAERIADLEGRVAAAEVDVKELASRLVKSEHQADQLMNLYVTTYQLHFTLDAQKVKTAIAEIAINLLGAERFVLLVRRGDGQGCTVALAEGFDGPPGPPYAGTIYEGGDPLVDAALGDGIVRLGPAPESRTLAAVPLRIQSAIGGALVIFELLAHKPVLGPDDRDLLDLLSAHAAAALFAADLYAAKERKLKTLESLVELARGQ